jgi:Zn-dependent M32 family carboxypeptidase
LSEKYIYFGNKGTTAYKLKYTELDKYLDGFKQGHRVNHSEALFNELQKLIQATINLKIEGKPSNPDSCKACDNIDGDVVVSTSIFTKCA